MQFTYAENYLNTFVGLTLAECIGRTEYISNIGLFLRSAAAAFVFGNVFVLMSGCLFFNLDRIK
jgi:hypothetical protein